MLVLLLALLLFLYSAGPPYSSSPAFMIQNTPRISGSAFHNRVLVVLVMLVVLVVIVLRTIYVITKTPTKTYYAFSVVVR